MTSVAGWHLLCELYHAILHTRNPKIPFSIWMRICKETPCRAAAAESCCRPRSVFMQGTKKDSPTWKSPQGTIIGTPSGFIELFSGSIFRPF